MTGLEDVRTNASDFFPTKDLSCKANVSTRSVLISMNNIQESGFTSAALSDDGNFFSLIDTK